MQAPSEVLVDQRGARCPAPLIALARAVRRASPGQAVVLVADDPAARTDVPLWCRLRRHRLEEVADAGEAVRFRVTPRARRSTETSGAAPQAAPQAAARRVS